MFDGSLGSREQFLRISGWREQADTTGLIAVFPTGLRYRMLASGWLSTKCNSFDLAEKVDLDEWPAGYPDSSPMPADDEILTDPVLGPFLYVHLASLGLDANQFYALARPE